MAENVVRQDIVELLFDSNLKELTKINKEIDDLKKKVTGGVGDEEFEKLKNNSNDAIKPLKKVKEQVDKATKSLTNLGKKAATTAFKGLKKLAGISFKALTVGIAAASAAIGVLVKNAVSAYAEYEQLFGGVETLLGAKGAKSVQEYAKMTGKSVSEVQKEYKSLMESQNLVMKNANNAYKTAGLSANDYMTTVTGFSASLLQSLGGDTVKTAKLADVAISDMADNANKMGTPMENIQNAYAGFAKQNFTLLDNLKLGYGGTKSEMERLLSDAEKIKAKMGEKVDFKITSYADMIEAIHTIQKDMDITGTTAKEADKTITGSLNSMKSAWQNLMPALIQGGDSFDQCVDNFIDSAKIFGKNIMPAIEKALGGVGRLIEEFAPMLEENLPSIIDSLLPPLVKSAVSLANGLVKALPSIIKIIEEQLPKLIDLLLPPFLDIAVALTIGIIKALPSIIKTISAELPDILKQIGQAFSEAFGDVPILGGIFKFITENSDTISKFVPVLLGLAGALMVFSKIKSIGGGLSSMFGKSKGGEGGENGGFLGTLSNLAKMKTTDILKGMANLAIIIGGFVGLAAILLLVAPYITKLGDLGSLLKLVVIIGVLGVVGGVLAKFGEIAGKVPVATVVKGLANMAIMIGGMSAVLAIVSLVAMIPFDFVKVLQISAIIGVLGIVGAALTVLGAIVGLIPVAIVALGLANMGIMIGGMAALLLMIGSTSLFDFDLNRLTQIVMIIGLLGTVGAALSLFAGIIGLIPIPIVLLGIANMALVLAGVAKIGNQLTTFANNTAGFFTKVASFPEKGFSNGAKLFDCLAGLKSLPKDGGVMGWFSGSIDYSQIANGLTQLSSAGVIKFFTMVSGLKAQAFTNTAALFKSLANINTLPKEGGLWGKITGNKSSSLGKLAEELSVFGSKTSSFFAQVNILNLKNLNGLWDSLKEAGKLTTINLSKIFDGALNTLVSKIAELPKKMGDALRNNSKNLSNGIVEMWKAAVKASVAPVNKLISGANHILKEFGSKKRAISWQPYAKGTNGHKGGNALVNDGRGAELIQMPNGRMFIPNGRNVFLPNAPKGMKVLPAEQTARLLGKSSPSFRYADGVGDIDIWSYYNNAKGLVNKISDGISYDGMSAFATNVGSSMVSTFKGAMTPWVEKLFREEGARSLSSYIASRGVSQWRSTVAQALKMEGIYSIANVARTLFQMQTESGGNPMAINLWDSNAKKGTPSKGLMQVIDPTFKAYARAGFNKNIYDPLSNILASVRYAVARYGSLSKAYRGVGYSNGVGTVTLPEQSNSTNLTYTPESDSKYYNTNSVEYNNYSPQFNITISGTSDDRVMARKVKRWIAEAWEDMLDNLESKTPQTQQV